MKNEALSFCRCLNLICRNWAICREEMASRDKLTDEEWSNIYAILLNNKRVYTISENKCRDFVNAVVWILRSGIIARLTGEMEQCIQAI